MEAYDKIKKTLAVAFINDLDNNRPEGKMCLSNGECAEIEKAFNEQDWPKLARYLDKYTESEDERIRKEIIECIETLLKAPGASPRLCDWLAWLEKQKDAFENGRQLGIMQEQARQELEWTDGKQKEQKPDIELIQRSWYMEGYRDGNFGNEPKWIVKTGKGGPRYEENPKYGQLLKEQKPAEWSEEDERIRHGLIEKYKNEHLVSVQTGMHLKEIIRFLENLRPQPHKEIYQAAKHNLAIKFMNYLDENRPEGKMCLSNGECEDIDKAFKENDWAKIVRYIDKMLKQR